MIRARGHRRRLNIALCAVWSILAATRLLGQDLRLPNAADSVKFAVIGDSGTGDRPQLEIADQMLKFHALFKFDRVIMLGDNIYGGQSPADLEKKFAVPYKALTGAGVVFYASLGNHDSPNNKNYPPFHMGGQRYYSFATKQVRFFVLDTDSLDPAQLAWLEGALKAATEPWKVCYFHHPLYSDGGTHGSDVNLRTVLEPLFVTYGVNVVFSGHDHIYERITPQKGVYYFVCGSAGQLRPGDLDWSEMTAAGFDKDRSFMLVEIGGNTMSFEAVSRTGQVVDSGTLPRQAPRQSAPAQRPAA